MGDFRLRPGTCRRDTYRQRTDEYFLTQGSHATRSRLCPHLPQSATTSGMRLMRGSVKISNSSRLVLENSETTAPSSAAWNQCSVLGGMVYWSPGCNSIS